MSNTSFIEIENILIVLDTNIKGKAPVPFTRELLNYRPVATTPEEVPPPEVDTQSWSNLPFFTTTRRLPVEVLNKMKYPEVVQFFFDRATFQRYIRKVPVTTGNVIDSNIITMLKLLLPTFPVAHQVRASFGGVGLGVGTEETRMTLTTPPMEIILEGAHYVPRNLVWLNDLLHHPKYHRIMDRFNDFNYWKASTRVDILQKMKETEGGNMPQVLRDQFTYIMKYLDTLPKSKRDSFTKKYGLDRQLITLKTVIDSPTTSVVERVNLLYPVMKWMKEVGSIQFTDPVMGKKYAQNKRDIDRIYLYHAVLTKYFGEAIDLSFGEDDTDIKNFMETYFQYYIRFGKDLTLFTNPHRESTNKFFQDKLNTFIQGKGGDFENYIHRVEALNETLSSSPPSKNSGKKGSESVAIPPDVRNFMYVGLSKFANEMDPEFKDKSVGQAKYEIYVAMDMDPSDKVEPVTDTSGNRWAPSYQCQSKNDDLVAMFERLRYPTVTTPGVTRRRRMITAPTTPKKKGGYRKTHTRKSR